MNAAMITLFSIKMNLNSINTVLFDRCILKGEQSLGLYYPLNFMKGSCPVAYLYQKHLLFVFSFFQNLNPCALFTQPLCHEYNHYATAFCFPATKTLILSS